MAHLVVVVYRQQTLGIVDTKDKLRAIGNQDSPEEMDHLDSPEAMDNQGKQETIANLETLEHPEEKVLKDYCPLEKWSLQHHQEEDQEALTDQVNFFLMQSINSTMTA